MTYVLSEKTPALLETMAKYLSQGANHPLVNFEVQRRMDRVPRNLMELFLMEPDTMRIRDWHVLSPWERFAWVGTLMRRRVPSLSLDMGADAVLVMVWGDYTYEVSNCLPKDFSKKLGYWKSMDDFCLLIGVCFYLAVMELGEDIMEAEEC